MEIIDMLPLSIYEFTCDETLVDRISSIITTLPTAKNEYNSSTKTDLFYDAELYDWLNSCIDEAKEKLFIPKDVKLDITSCWANTTKKLQQHHLHPHPNSFMSGILYLSDNHVGGKTEFITDNIWWKHFSWIKFGASPGPRTINQQYVPQKGRLLLFPSSLLHKVTAVSNNSIRYSIAFNTFFSGPIGDANGLIRLELKSKSVADHYEA